MLEFDLSDLLSVFPLFSLPAVPGPDWLTVISSVDDDVSCGDVVFAFSVLALVSLVISVLVNTVELVERVAGTVVVVSTTVELA